MQRVEDGRIFLKSGRESDAKIRRLTPRRGRNVARGGLVAEESGTPAQTQSPVREKMTEKRKRGTVKLIKRESEIRRVREV